MGVEPTPSAWKAEVLPLNYTRDDSGPATPGRTMKNPAPPAGVKPINRAPRRSAARCTTHSGGGAKTPALRARPAAACRFAPGESVEPLSVLIPPCRDRGRCLARSPYRPRSDSGGGGRITPGILPSALRARPAAACRFAPGESVEPLSVLIPPCRDRGRCLARSPYRPRCHSRFWWRGEDSNLRRLSRQIYSLIPLAAREPLPGKRNILSDHPGSVNRFLAPQTHRWTPVSGSIGALARGSRGSVIFLIDHRPPRHRLQGELQDEGHDLR